MATRSRRRSSDDEYVDLSGVEVGGGRRSAHLPEEENPFTFKATGVKLSTGKDSGKKYIDVKCVVTRGDYKGKAVYANLSLQPKALFNLKGMMEASGIKSDGKLRVSAIIKQLEGKTFQANVADDEWNGKMKSVIDTYVVETRKRRAIDDDDEEDEEDEEEEDDEEEEEEDEDEDEEEEDEEEEEKPRRKTSAKSSKTAKSSTKPAAKKKAASASRGRSRKSSDDDDDEDLDDLELDDI